MRMNLLHLMHAKTCPHVANQFVQVIYQIQIEMEQRLRDLQADLKVGVPKKLADAVTLLEQRLASTRSYMIGFRAKKDTAEAEVERVRPEVERFGRNWLNAPSRGG